MVSQICKDRNIFYIGDFEPRHDLVQGTPDRNIMQAGIRKEKTYLERLDDLIQQADNLLNRGPQQGLVQAGNTEERQNIKQAGIQEEQPTDNQVFETMFAFMNDSPFDAPDTTRRNVFQGGLPTKVKRANIATDNPTDVLDTMLRFGGLS